MTDYTMPVLSEQERDKLTDYCKYRISELAEYSLQAKCLKIALAALTAEPVAFGYEDGLFECGGKISSTATRHYVNPLYAAPPVPVIKQEGEQ